MQFFESLCVKLIRMAKQNDKNRFFDEIVSDYQSIVYKVCYMYASDADHLKDLTQEVYANIWQGLDTFRGESRISTWVYRVAINTCITFFRRNDRHSHTATLDDALHLPNDTDTTERELMLRQMYELISSLGKVDKALIMLWLEEYSYDEIAAISGLTRNNVASRLLRAKRLLVKRSNQ